MKPQLLALLIFFTAAGVSSAQSHKFGKVSKEEIFQEKHPIDPEANAAILYRESVSEFRYNANSGWTLLTEYFERIKIYNKEGFDWANITITRSKNGSSEDKVMGLKGYTYYIGNNGKIEEVKLKNDGIFDTEISKYQNETRITMPDIREGCVIEYKYSLESPFIFHIDEFKFQETIPVDKVSMEFKAPEYFVYQTYQKGWIPYKIDNSLRDRSLVFSQAVKDFSGYGSNGSERTSMQNVKFKENRYSVNLENVPAIKEEAYAGNIQDYTSTLQFELSHINFPGQPMQHYATTWEDVSKTIYSMDSFGAELDRASYFAKDIDALLAGITKPEEKAAKIFTYVVNKMTWNNYNGYYTNLGVREAYKKSTGNVADINLMLTSMLRYANLDANPVLVSTKANGMALFPTRSGFNYVIAAVNLPQGTVLLDATNKNAEMGVLASKVMNGDGRLIKLDHSSSWIPLRPLSASQKNTMVNVEIKEDGAIEGKARNRFTFNYAFEHRNLFRTLNNEGQRNILEKNLKGVELSEILFENLETPESPLNLTYDFRSMGDVEEVGGKLYFSPMMFLASKVNPFKLEKRDYPIDFGYPKKDKYIINIAIPEGYVVENLPENVHYDLGKMGGYRYMISEVGNNLQLSVEFSIDDSFIAAQHYDGIKRFYELMVKKENEKVVFKKA